MPDSKITAVVFDIGGVLLDWNPRHLYRELISDPAELEFFLTAICSPDWHLAHDLGVATDASCRELARLHPEYGELIMAWSLRSEEMIAGVFDDTIEVLRDLRSAGVRCYALSNMEPEMFARRRARFSFFDLFDGWVISGIEGVVKPEQKIFEILLTRYQLRPAETVFIDDQPRNVAAAAELGVAAILFTTAAQLRQELAELGLPLASKPRS
jgi:2-haloacid dehalogenase